MLKLSLVQQWGAEVQRCIEGLEPDDKHQVKGISSYQQLQTELQNPWHTFELTSEDSGRLLPSLHHLRIFALFFSESVDSKADTKPLWGMLHLTIQVASQVDSGLPRLTQMLKGVARRAEVFNEYCKREQTTDAVREATFDAHVTLLHLYANTIQFFRKELAYRSSESQWEPLAQIFQKTSSDMDDALQRIEKLASITKENLQTEEIKRLHNFLSASSDHSPPSSDYLGPTPPADASRDEANLPCIVLPSSRFSFSRSYNRDEILEAIRSHFGTGYESFSSIALHGVGGVGKTHIAHKYAYLESKQRTYDAILWIHSDTRPAIEQSFTDAAVRLQLPGASPQNHTENRIRVLTWLQQTNCLWLLIFDNAEDPQLLTDYWPTAGRGHAIVTTRNHSLAFDPADRGIEISSFAPDGGSKLLMQLLSLDVTSEIADSEVKSALELSEKLRGHALAISQMAGLIHRRSWTITEFISVYEKSTQRFNHRALDAVWRLSFESLGPESSEFLGVVSYVAPDSIPQALFESEQPSDLPENLQFCADDFIFSDVLETLMTLALVKRDKDTREFSVHRLVQAQFTDFMTFKDRQRAFWNAANLLLRVFPHSGGRLGQLYAQWGRCRLYLQHVLTLASHYRESNKVQFGKSQHQQLRASQPFCRLLAYCCRYLIEQVSLEELHEMSKLAIDAYATLDESEKDLYLNGLIQNQYGFGWYLQGDFELAEKHWKNGLDLHEKISPPDHRAVAWRSYNMGLVTAGQERYETAVSWYLRSEECWAKSGDETLSCVAWMRSQRAQALTFLRKFEDAEACFAFATSHLKESKEWGWLAFTYFAEGNLYRELSQFRFAESKYHAAQEAWKSGDQTRVHNFYAACLYKLACIAIDQSNFQTAKEYLDNARDITRLQAHRVSADYQRVLNKLYQLSTLMPEQKFDLEVTEDGPKLFEKTFGAQSDTSFENRETRFDSRVNCNWR